MTLGDALICLGALATVVVVGWAVFLNTPVTREPPPFECLCTCQDGEAWLEIRQRGVGVENDGTE